MTKQTTTLILLLAGMMMLALFMVSYQVQDLEEKLEQLNQGIAADREAVHVLEAEWAHLNDPERLRSLAERHLGLQPMGADQLVEPETVPWRGPDTDAVTEGIQQVSSPAGGAQ